MYETFIDHSTQSGNLFVTPKPFLYDFPEVHEIYVHEEQNHSEPLLRVPAEMASVSPWIAVFSSGILRGHF
jgi:hypothetical protein